MNPRIVEIHYRRPPDRIEVFRQKVLEETPSHVATLLESASLPRPLLVHDRPILEPGARVVWFTFPGTWYDVGRFHLRDGTFTGYYANILTPVRMEGDRWETTDLFLDVWVGADGSIELLDEDEFARAIEAGWLDDPATIATALATAEAIITAAREGRWPPRSVQESAVD